MTLYGTSVIVVWLFVTTAPLVKIKQAMQKLKQEMTQMDIRIGVVQHVLLQAKLKEKVSQNRGITTHDDDDEDTYNFKGSF